MKAIPLNVFLIILFLFIISGCKKDAVTSEEKTITHVKVFDDNSIYYPIEIIAGKGTLLSAYHTWGTNYNRFLLTDNNGNLLWTKEFGLSSLSGMVAEDDGTFTIFSNKRLINVDVAGNVLKDIPDFLLEINNYFPIHVLLNKNGNYLFYGRISAFSPHYAFAFEITHTGVKVFKKIYIENTVFTGCQLTSDGGYLFLGNLLTPSITLPAVPTRFFICKMNSTGNVDWINYYLPPGQGVNLEGNINFTHDILETNDGNYFCFVGSTNKDINIAARIYKVDPNGNLLDSTDINFATKNFFVGGNEFGPSFSYPMMNGYCAVKKPDGSYLVYLNYRKLWEIVSYVNVIKENQTFAMHFGDDLSVQHIGYLQNNYPDYFASVCATSDGKTAAFGSISSFGQLNKPILIITE